MDIIDAILGGAFSPKGSISTYAALAQKAVADANIAVNNIDTITEQTAANNEAAAQALSNANDALAAVTEALSGFNGETQLIDSEIDKFILSLTTSTTNTQISKNLISTYPDNHTNPINNIIIMYQQPGNNTDGTMTQKAITNYVNSAISNISGGGSSSGGGGNTNLGSDNAGNIVVVGPDGNIIAGDTTETAIIEALIKSGSYSVTNTAGIEIDYENKSYERTQDAANLGSGTDFNQYPMYGGRMRCNVADNGTITAWYGDDNYRDDGSNGQVMVYQPKFYYQRTIISSSPAVMGRIVHKESIIVSPVLQTGFKLHPLFINENNEEIDYVLLPVYDGSVYDTSANSYITNDGGNVNFSEDKLSSVAGVKPASGKNNNFTVANAEQIAQNRGTGWHILNIRALSAEQMLMTVEYGSPNGQYNIELGTVSVTSNPTQNCATITGSTASLGNTTGYASLTNGDINGNRYDYTTNGYRAISYRGIENPWGNIWTFVGGINIYGNGGQNAGVPYICSNYNFNVNSNSNNYTNLGFYIPSVAGQFISALGYGDSNLDWVLMPIEAVNANSAVPIGDAVWGLTTLNGYNLVAYGGMSNSGDKAGMFYYSCDTENTHHSASFGAKIMFVPTINSIYEANKAAWQQKWGG